MREDRRMAMRAMILMLAVGLAGSAARAQDATEQRDPDQKMTAAQSVTQAEQAKRVAAQSAMQAEQAKVAAAQSVMGAEQAKMAAQRSVAEGAQAKIAAAESLTQEAQARMAADQSLMEARLATLGPRLAVEQTLMAARLATLEPKLAVEQSLMAAKLATLEPKLAAERGLMMAQVGPLEGNSLGLEMQTGASVPRVGQAKDELFAGTEKFAKGASYVTEVNLDPSNMGLVGAERVRNGDLAKRMRFMVVHTYEYPREGMYNPEDVEVYRKKLGDGSWNCSIHVKDKDGTTDICSRSTPDREGSEMVIIAAEKKDLTFIHMSGKMSLDELQRMNGGQGRKALPVPPAAPNPPPAKGQKGAEPVAPAAPVPPVAPGH